MDKSEINKRFTTSFLNRDEERSLRHILNEFRLLAIEINYHVPDCRRKSLALTRLEEAQLWAAAAMGKTEE